VRNSLLVCFSLNFLSRLVMSTTQSVPLLLIALLGPNAVAGALGVPVMTIGVKRFTTAENRGFAFSLFYSIMNLGALAQGMLMDVFRINLRHGFNIPSISEHSFLNNGSRLFLFTGECACFTGEGRMLSSA
jgi:sugar phosphate permease